MMWALVAILYVLPFILILDLIRASYIFGIENDDELPLTTIAAVIIIGIAPFLNIIFLYMVLKELDAKEGYDILEHSYIFKILNKLI